MALPTPPMQSCCKKQRCLFGINIGEIFDVCDPCQGTGVFNPSTCDCEKCYGAKVTYTTCGDNEEICYRKTNIKCEDSLGGCPTLYSVTDASGYACGESYPDGYSINTVWQYPDGSYVTEVIIADDSAQIKDVTVSVMSGVTCGQGDCSQFD